MGLILLAEFQICHFLVRLFPFDLADLRLRRPSFPFFSFFFFFQNFLENGLLVATLRAQVRDVKQLHCVK